MEEKLEEYLGYAILIFLIFGLFVFTVLIFNLIRTGNVETVETPVYRTPNISDFTPVDKSFIF